MLEALTGQTPGVFIGLTLVLTGAAAISMGRALARTWRPIWQIVPYALLLGATNRFLSYALFQEPLLHLVGFLVISVILVLLALFTYRIARTNKMVAQYPWLYERATPFSLRARHGT